jgi:predicted metalloprotease with PDZ domain
VKREQGEGVSGDIIVAVDAVAVESVARLLSRLDDHQIGDTVRLTVLRDGRKADVAVKLQAVKLEGEAKIASLQQQLKTARDERKQRLEKWLAEIRADYRERSHKLHQAWELTKSALR